MKLAKNNIVRCRNEENDLIGEVLLASETQPQSVAVFLGLDAEGIRMKGALAITNMLALTVDYEKETAVDLFGNEWEIEVAE